MTKTYFVSYFDWSSTPESLTKDQFFWSKIHTKWINQFNHE